MQLIIFVTFLLATIGAIWAAAKLFANAFTFITLSCHKMILALPVHWKKLTRSVQAVITKYSDRAQNKAHSEQQHDGLQELKQAPSGLFENSDWEQYEEPAYLRGGKLVAI